MSQKKFNPKDNEHKEQYDQINGMTGREIIAYVQKQTYNVVNIKIATKNKRGIIKAAILALKYYAPKLEVKVLPIERSHPPIGKSAIKGCKAPNEAECLDAMDSCDCLEGRDIPKVIHHVDLSRMNKRTLIARAEEKFGKRIGGFMNAGLFMSRFDVMKKIVKLYQAEDYSITTGIHGV